jgi:hypothetical protein
MKKKMQCNKRVHATSIMAFLVFSMVLACMPMANAAGAITLTPTTQVPGASVTVSGTGFGANQAVGIGFGAEVNVINETMSITASGTGPHTGYASHLPIKPGTFKDAANVTSTLWMIVGSDAGNGTITTSVPLFVNGTINYVTGQYTRFTTIPPTSVYQHLCNYTYFQNNVTPPAGVTTNPSGAFSASIIVPRVADGNYVVTAVDTAGNKATATLNVVPEGLTIGVMVLLSTVAVIVSTRYFRKRQKIENCSQAKL